MKIGLQPGTKALHIELANDGSWLIWLHEPRQEHFGTYLHLRSCGQVDRVTEREDGTYDRSNVKPSGGN